MRIEYVDMSVWINPIFVEDTITIPERINTLHQNAINPFDLIAVKKNS